MFGAKDAAFIKKSLIEIGPAVEQPIKYCRYSHTTPGQPHLGIPDQVHYDVTDEKARVRELTLEEVQASAGRYVLGDIRVVTRRTVQPDYRDQIEWDGMRFSIVECHVSHLIEGVGWTLKCRKITEA